MNTTPLLDLLSHTALKGSAVLLMALLLGLILRRMAAARRYALWITSIATLAILPLAMWVLPEWHVLPKAPTALDRSMMAVETVSENAGLFPLPEDLDVTASAAGPSLPAPAPVTTRPAFSWEISWQDVVEYLPVVWMLIAGLLVLRLGRSAWRLQRLEVSLSPGECAMLGQTARELGLQRLPRVFIGPRDSVPMVWGVVRPRLLLPQVFESWSREKQRGVLLHELAHLKRGDPLALWAAQWVKALHWFNPLIWLTFRQLRADQERACDDAVLRHGVRASDYAQSLLDLSRHTRLAPRLSLCALTITRCAPVEARVQAILDPQRRRDGLNLRWLAGLAGCALLITLPMAMLHAIEGPPLRGRILDRNGVVLAESTKEKVRVYPLKTLAAHVVGYARLPESDDARLHGGAGVEKKEDATLKEGKDVALTLDARIQALTLQAMKNGSVERGAAVVLDPRTSEILAFVSLPSFDPNFFIPSISFKNWDRYLKDIDIPLLNRAVKGYVPGDAFTPLTALVGISKGLGDKTFNCRPATTSYQSKFECLQIRQGGKGHGTIGLEQALQNSCRHYWCQLGMLAGFDAFGKMGKDIGFGQQYGVSEDESAGVLPTQDWWEKRRLDNAAWSEGNTAALAEGYGYANVTPLQMAVLAATVANSGRAPQPILTKSAQTSWRADLSKEGLPVAQIEKLREGMRLVVNSDSGTGQSARSTKVMVAGKNGATKGASRTDQGELVERNHSWFIGFAPFDQPTLAFAILNQGGKTVGDCGPIAKRIVEEALALPADGAGEVKPVEEKSMKVQAKADIEVVPEPPRIFNKTNAKVIIRSSSASSHSLIIDKGSLDGIVANRPVIARGGLVGKTAVPEPHTTKVILLTDELCLVSAKVEGTVEQGILSSERAAQEVEPQLRLRFLSRGAKINIGSKVYSTGEGGVFPAYQRLGRVKEFIPGDISGEAIVEPAVDSSTLDEVFVIELKNEPPAQKAPTPSKSADQAHIHAEIRMKPALANQWAVLKKAGHLADLPPEARPFDLETSEERRVKSVYQFHFSVPREAARRWLLASVYVTEPHATFLDWPKPPTAFQRSYAAADLCSVSIHCADGEMVHVTVKKNKPRILIAPDESQEPRPAGRLEPEHHRDGLTQSEAMPTLNVVWQTLCPTISSDERERLPTFRLQPIQLRLQAPGKSS